jgi:cell shape-determining protein MreC
MKVRIGRFSKNGFVLADGYYWIVGRGGSTMEIRDVEARIAQAAAVEVGDLVLSDSTNEMLPAALTIGHVAAIIPDRDNPLFVHLAVKPVLNPAELDRVYVYDPQSEPSP